MSLIHIHEKFVKNRNLDVLYRAPKKRESSAKVAAYKDDARRGSSDSHSEPPSNFWSKFCAAQFLLGPAYLMESRV